MITDLIGRKVHHASLFVLLNPMESDIAFRVTLRTAFLISERNLGNYTVSVVRNKDAVFSVSVGSENTDGTLVTGVLVSKI